MAWSVGAPGAWWVEGKVPEALVKPLLCAALSGRQAPPGWLQGGSRRPVRPDALYRAML